MNCKEKVVIGGKTWYYQIFYADDECEAVRLYGEDGEFVKEFETEESMMKWIAVENGREQREVKEEIQKTFMHRFEHLRGVMTDKDFAAYLEMPAATVYQYLTGRRFPTAMALMQIAKKCGTSIDWLVGKE